MMDPDLQSDRELLGEILAKLDQALLNQDRLIKAQEATRDVIRQIWAATPHDPQVKEQRQLDG